jgi:hypothetical protein
MLQTVQMMDIRSTKRVSNNASNHHLKKEMEKISAMNRGSEFRKHHFSDANTNLGKNNKTYC